MTRALARLVPCTLVMLAGALLVPPAAAADPFAGYRIPEHDWRSGIALLSLHGDRTQVSSPYLQSEYRSGAFSGAFGGVFSGGFDSDRRQHAWRLEASFAQDGHHSESQNPGTGMTLDRSGLSQDDAERLAGEASTRRYFGASAIGLELSAAGSAGLSQSWNRSDTRYYSAPDPANPFRRTRNTRQSCIYDYAADLGAAFGHGIVRDATPAEDAHVLEARLLETGALVRPLSAAARARLAALLAVEPTLADVHDRPDRYFWGEIEKVLREDGALAVAGLDAHSLERAREPWTMRGLRRRGYFVAATLQLEHQHWIRRESVQNTDAAYSGPALVGWLDEAGFVRSVQSSDLARAGAKAEWHQPAGWNWQWDASGAFSVPVRTDETGLRTDAFLQASWHVADRWLVQGSFTQVRDYLLPDERDDTVLRDRWSTLAALSVQFYLEDRTQLSVTLTDEQSHFWWYSPVDVPERAHYGRATRLEAGLTYRFLGRVSAPGLFETMTRL